MYKTRSGVLVLAVSVLLMLLSAWSCQAQNGPTAPMVKLSWVQSVGDTNPVAKNCVYRGSSAGVYTTPALFCSTAPVTAYTDTQVVRGTVYHYAVTAVDSNGAESAFSSDLQVTSPVINSPTGLATVLVSKLERLFELPQTRAKVFTNKSRTLTAEVR